MEWIARMKHNIRGEVMDWFWSRQFCSLCCYMLLGNTSQMGLVKENWFVLWEMKGKSFIRVILWTQSMQGDKFGSDSWLNLEMISMLIS